MNIDYTDVLLKISQRIIANSSESYGLYQGKAGELLFQATLVKHYPSAVDGNYLQNCFSEITESCQALLPDISLADGVTGIAWLIEYLAGFQPELATLNNSFDTYLKSVLSVGPCNDELEVTKGAAGIFPYLKLRSGMESVKETALFLMRQLENKAVWFSNSSCSWPTHQESLFRIQKLSSVIEFNLGLAHGVPGIIAALLPWYDDSCPGVLPNKLVVSGCNWLMAQRQNPAELGSYYPDIVNSTAISRLAWCYGDLTIALTFGRVALLSKNKEYYEFGREIAIYCATRRGDASLIKGTALCHGSAGASLIFRLLTEIYPDYVLKEASEYWFDYTLKGITSTLMSDSRADSEGKFSPSSGLLNGYAGIGLSIISNIYNDTSWTSGLLLR